MNEDNNTVPEVNKEVSENIPLQSDTPAITTKELDSETVSITPQETTVVTPTSVTPQEQPSPISTTSPVATSTGPEPVSTSKSKFSKSKWFLPAVLFGFLLLGGGAAAYLTVFKKSPENAWKSALANTASGIEKYIENSYNAEQKGFKIEGDFKVTTPIAIDGSLEGQWNDTKGALKADVGASGARINMELKTIPAEGSKTPDLYLKVNGLEGVDDLIASFGGPEQSGYSELLTSINDQWYFIDHTLIDQYTASTESSSGIELTEEDIKEISDRVMVVLKDRMFSTQGDKAVFTIAETMGKEDFEGTSSFKMRVQVNKENFKQFVTALKDSIKDTKAEELLKAGNPEGTLEEALDFERVLKDIEDTDFSKGYADVWVEANGGFIRNVRFYPVEGKESSNYLDIGMNYKGGDEFPFLFKAVMDDDGQKGTITFGLDVNQANGDATVSFGVNLDSGDVPIKAEGKMSIKGSSDDVNVEKPENAKNIFELMSGFQQSLGLGATGIEEYDNSLILDSSLDGSLPLDDSEL